MYRQLRSLRPGLFEKARSCLIDELMDCVPEGAVDLIVVVRAERTLQQ